MVKEIRDTFLIFLQDDQGSHGSGILTLRENVCLPVEAGRGQFQVHEEVQEDGPLQVCHESHGQEAQDQVFCL